MFYELMTQNPWFFYGLMALFTLAVGSLLNVIIYRLPIMLIEEWKEECQALMKISGEKKQTINLFFPRSFCPTCKTKIKAWQNIPIMSYLLLGGRCHHCKNLISPRYPFIEASTMLLSLYSCLEFGFSWQLAFALVFLWLLICLFFIDLEYQLLPDCLSLSLLWLGLIGNSAHLFTSLTDAVLSAAGAYIALWIFVKLFYLLTGKIGMGHGDFKLFAAFGAWFGWKCLPLILLLSSILGTLIGLFYLYLHSKPKDTTIPFGPFLCVSGLIALFWGQKIINWYFSLIILL
jgi:leader peptidase (prepilin peptidase)/N-methyltransferase